MGLRFSKSIKIAPGVKLNIGKRGINSITIGNFNFGKRGLYHNLNVAGTGISYRTKLFGKSKTKQTQTSQDPLDIQLELKEDGSLLFFDHKGKPLSALLLKEAKKQHREQIMQWLDEQTTQYNAEIEALVMLYTHTPPPTTQNKSKTDIEGMSKILSDAFQSIEWPRETLVSFDIVDEGQKVLLDVDLPEIEDMPSQEARVNKTKLAISLKDISQTNQRVNYIKHIHAIGFRFIGEVFASLPAANEVVFSGFSQRTNKKTGHIADDYLYSTRVHRPHWQKINFDNLEGVDVVACFEQFDLHRKTTKTGVISPITPFER